MSSPPAAIPLGDAAGFGRRIRAVRRIRRGAAVLVVAAGMVFALVSFNRPATGSSLLPQSATGVVVLDVSASISSDTYARIKATLDRLIASNSAYGLVVFSDTAYQALPPQTPARELRPFARFFDLTRPSGPGALPEPPRSPFTDSFSGGTRISTGLALALEVIRKDRLVRPAVLLVSDLDDDTGDVERVAQVATAYRRAQIPLHVVGLNASPEDAAFIRRLTTGTGSFTEAGLPSTEANVVPSDVDPLLALAAVLLAAGLGAFLLVSEPLRWSSR